MFHKNLFDILVSRVESPNERENFLDDFGLFLIAVLRDENWASAKMQRFFLRGKTCPATLSRLLSNHNGWNKVVTTEVIFLCVVLNHT